MDLSKKEEQVFLTIKDIVKNRITKKEAEQILGKSRRQIDRLIIKYKEEGKKGFIHKNKGKINQNKTSESLILKIEELYLQEYFDYNFEAFYEELIEKYNCSISYSVMVCAFKRDDIISPLSHKSTIKLYNEKMKKAISENIEEGNNDKIELYKSRLIASEKAHTRKSNNLYAFGQEIQMDACFKFWFGNISSALHLAVDKGTKKVLFGWFEYEELTRAYFILLYNIIINYGIPSRIKTDNRNSFSTNKNKTDSTQFGMICDILQIELKTSSQATSKPNVERENKTFKDRLIAELRHENITTIDEANYYLNNIFIPKMNKKFSYEIDYKKSKMRVNNYSEEELNLIISEKYYRIIDNASSIQYNKKYYIPFDLETGEQVTYSNKTECQIIIAYDNTLWCKIEEHYYKLIELENRDSIMKKEKDNDNPIERKKYIPPSDHPWRKSYKSRLN